MNVTSCALAAIKSLITYIAPRVNKKDINLLLDNFLFALYIVNPNIIVNIIVTSYIAYIPPLSIPAFRPMFCPILYIWYVPKSYNQCGYV